MTKVFVVTPADFDWQEPVAVFLTEEEAIAYTKEPIDIKSHNKIFTKHFCISELQLQSEIRTKVLVKETEYCEDGACAPSYHTTILGIITENTNVEAVISNYVKDHGYSKNSKGEWTNGLNYGWEVYQFKIKEIPIL